MVERWILALAWWNVRGVLHEWSYLRPLWVREADADPVLEGQVIAWLFECYVLVYIATRRDVLTGALRT